MRGPVPATDAAAPPWLARAADARTTVLFLDTDALVGAFTAAVATAAQPPAPHARCAACTCAAGLPDDGAGAWEEGGTRSAVEARVLLAVATALLRGGVRAQQIGVIAPFNAQVATLRAAFVHAPEPAARPVEVETIDRYQGRDKDAILFSFARSARWLTDGSAGSAAPPPPPPPTTAAVAGASCDTELAAAARPRIVRASGGALDSIERLAVALTRAKAKLVFAGSAAALRAASPALARLLAACERRGWLAALPPADAGGASAGAALLAHPLHRLAALYCGCACHA